MFATIDSARRGSVAFGGLLLAALLSGADLASPTTAAAQTISADKALLSRFEAGFRATGSGAAIVVTGTDAATPSPERALLGKVEPVQAAEQARENGTVGSSIKPAGGEQALLGRRGRDIS